MIELRDIIPLEVAISRQTARCGRRRTGRGRQRHSGGRRCQNDLRLLVLRDPKRVKEISDAARSKILRQILQKFCRKKVRLVGLDASCGHVLPMQKKMFFLKQRRFAAKFCCGR